MICPQCQGENDAGARFCGHCGAELPAQAQGVYCAQCGAFNAEGSRFCGECGASIGPQPRDDDEPVMAEPAARPRKTSGAWWLMPIFLAWVGGLVAWLVVREDDPGKAKWMLILGILITVAWFLLWAIIVLVTLIFVPYG